MQPISKTSARIICIMTLLGLSVPGFGDQSAASVDQIGGNVSTIYQSGSANTASDAFAHGRPRRGQIN